MSLNCIMMKKSLFITLLIICNLTLFEARNPKYEKMLKHIVHHQKDYAGMFFFFRSVFYYAGMFFFFRSVFYPNRYLAGMCLQAYPFPINA